MSQGRDRRGIGAKSGSRALSMMVLWGMALLVAAAVWERADAAITYVQGTYQNPDSSGLVTVTYASAQGAGDLNVVVVGWNDSTSTVSSITDSAGNTYVSAVGPTTNAGNATQRIYYAKNIASAAAGGNTVSVTFSTTVAYPDVRILEYSGLDPTNPLDVGIGASGTGTTQNSGSLTTTSANDLLVASNYVADSTTASGSGYTQRFITSGGELVEDQVVSATGSYSATSTQGGADWWVMQLAAFRAASTGGDTTPPTAPTSLTATAASSSQINLSWTASTDNVGVTGYLVQRCTGSSCTTFAQVGTSTTTSYSDAGLTASTSYAYQVRATDAAGNLSAFSNTASATTAASGGSSTIAYVQGTYQNPDSGNPVAVTYASAQSAGDLNVVVVGWNDSTSTVSSISDSKGNSYVSAVGPTTNAGNATQTLYYAKNIASAAAGSNTVTVTFSGTVAYPSVRILEYSGLDTSNPLDVGVGASGTGTTQNSGSLTTTTANDVLVASNYVDDSTTASGSGYTQRFITSGGELVEDQIVASTSTYSATSTQSGADWWVMQLAAFRAASTGGGDTTPPTAPRGLTVSVVSATQINLSWTASTDNVGVTAYLVERCSGASCSSFAQIGTSTTTTYSDVGLTGSTSYSYRVRATDAAGNLSSYSGTSSGTTSSGGGGGGDTTPPTAPSGVSPSVVSASQINLTWTASTDNVGVTGYEIQRCSGSGCTGFAQIGTSTTTSYSDTGLAASTSYSYQILATDAAGNVSSASSTATATTSASGDTQPPSNPTNLTATPGPMDTVLTWTASTDNVGVTGYFIERCQGVSCTSFVQIATVSGSTTSYTDSPVTADASYAYRVRATDAAGNLSGYSTSTSDTPLDCD